MTPGGSNVRDIDVRMAVRAKLAQQHAGDDSTRIVEEMGIWSGAVRVDVAVINGELCGYELKSDSDTLKRLPTQAEMYGKVFDRVTLVVGERLHKRALATIPEWWGCQVVALKDGVAILTDIREANKNPKIDPDILVQLLLKTEAIEILETVGLDKGWRSKKASDICARLIREIHAEDLASYVRTALKRRPKLGQSLSSDLDVPVQVQSDPHSGAAWRSGFGDGINLPVRPTMRQGAPVRSKGDYLLGIPPELLIHGHSAWTFGLHATEDHKMFGETVLGVDGGRKIDVGRRTGSDASVVAEVEPVRQRAASDVAPQRKLSPLEPIGPKRKARKSRRDTTAKQRDTTPLRPVQ